MKRFLVCFVLTAVCFLTAANSQQRKFPTSVPDGPLNTLTEKERSEGWVLLFNGKDLEGWEFDKGSWRVEDGVIISQNGPGHLFTNAEYKDFELSWFVCAYDVAVPKKRFGNSGVFLRAIKTGGNFPKGYEVQVDPYDVRNPTGGIYGYATGDLLVGPAGDWRKEGFFEVHEGKWLSQRIRIEGSKVQIWVNGKKTLDWTDAEKAFPDAGFIALQNHHSTDVVLFTSIKLKPLD